MTKSISHIIVASFLALLFSCQSHDKIQPSTYTIKTTTFEDILEINGLVQPVQTNVMACPAFVDGVVLFIVEDGTYVKKDEVVCILEDTEMKKRYTEAQANLETATMELNRTKADLDMQYALMEAQVKNNDAQTDIANLDSLEIKFSSLTQSRIKKLELELVSIEKQRLQKKLKSLAIINQSEIRKQEFQIQRLTVQVQSAKAQIDELTIKATQDGLATRGINWSTGKKVQVGDPVWNRMPLVVIPEMTKMKVNISATEGDYKLIDVNDSVEYGFDAMPTNRAWGKIEKKSPVGQPVKENSKVKMFEIEASMDKSIVIPGPDLSAHCKITLKRISDTIVIPQICIFEEDSMSFVYVQKSQTFEMRQIITGTSSLKDAVVTAGLRRNERISLSKPDAALINGKKMLPKAVVKKFSNKK
ncbi:MAG: hypothetical protein PHR83_08455 [Paludibacter sp.]|nr:hypothetical protein [Paludibacter sp.]